MIKKEEVNNSRIYLSDVIDPSQFKRGQANIVIAPCNAGKTTAAFRKIVPLASRPEKVVFLIDTSAGKEALLTREDTRRFSKQWVKEIQKEFWGEFPSGDGVRVLTYHQFGYQVIDNPDFTKDIEVIICDEMHNLIKYLGIEQGQNKKALKAGATEVEKPCEAALQELARLSNKQDGGPLVVIISATTNPVSVAFHNLDVKTEYFDLSESVTRDKSVHRTYYSNARDVLEALPMEERALVFVPTISLMEEYMGYVDDGWRNVCALWSINNEAHQMSDYQLEVRDVILGTHRIPEEIDVLFINAAYETSINIENEDFNTVIIHDSNPDTQVQVRGRLRHDIDTLYLYDKKHEHVADYFPEEYLGRFVASKDLRELAVRMNLRDEKGHLRKWPSIAKALEHDGYSVTFRKENNVRGCVVRRVS